MDQISFFQELYQYCEGSIELRPLPNAGDRIFIDCTNGLSQISPFCQQHQKSHLYFGIATRDGKGGGVDNLVDIPAVWCDADFNKTAKEILKSNLKRFPFKPSIIVASGGGVHFYWLLKEPTQDYKTVEDINHRIATQLQGDEHACDAARILRIPDTTNHKYPAPCKVHKHNQFRYELESFLDVLPESQIKPQGSLIIKDPDWLPGAMQGVGEGERNSTATKIAGYWINKLQPEDVATILETWNNQNNPPLSPKDIEKVVKSVTRYKPENPKTDIENVYDTKRMLKEYRAYIEALKQNKFVTGIDNIDEKIRGVAGGEVLTIIARAGSFKTALLQNLLRNYVKETDRGAIFFSLEMPIPSITERYYEMLNELRGDEVEDLYLSKDSGSLQATFEKTFIDELPNFFVVPVKIGMSDIPKYIKLIEENYQVKIGVIGIDYIGLMDAHGANEYEIISNIAKGIKTTAKMIGLPVILLSQVSRKGGEGETEITMDHGRGSGAIEESADFILGLWQVEKDEYEGGGLIVREKEYDLVCKILKNRKGPRGGKWVLDLNPATFVIGSDSEKYTTKKKTGKW